VALDSAMRGNACPISGSPEAQIAAQHAVINRFETALWEGGFNKSLLPSYQSASRRLEALIAARGDDRRHHFVLIIPVADSPAQLRRCLASLLELCRLYGYGGIPVPAERPHPHPQRQDRPPVLLQPPAVWPTQIRQYQWVQRDLDRITLNLVASQPLDAETLASLEAGIRRDVGAQMALEVSYLDDIPRTASGRHRFVIGITGH